MTTRATTVFLRVDRVLPLAPPHYAQLLLFFIIMSQVVLRLERKNHDQPGNLTQAIMMTGKQMLLIVSMGKRTQVYNNAMIGSPFANLVTILEHNP